MNQDEILGSLFNDNFKLDDNEMIDEVDVKINLIEGDIDGVESLEEVRADFITVYK